MLRPFLPLLLLLSIRVRSAIGLPWDPNTHPNHIGLPWRDPRDPISSHLPDYPMNLPEWLASSLNCREEYKNWDAPKLNVLYVAAHFCTNVSLPKTFHLPSDIPGS